MGEKRSRGSHHLFGRRRTNDAQILQTLANIDFEHDMALEKLELSETDPAFKRKIAKRLKEQHLERRDPYVRLLADLHNRAMPRAMLTH